MLKFWKSPLRGLGGLFAAGVLAAAPATIARPGTVNYVEGNVSLDGQALAAKSIGSTEINPGQALETGQGKAEVLLTPGVFLRMGDNAALRVIWPSLTDTRVELEKGQALVEVDEIKNENHLAVLDHGVNTTLEKKGLYKFDADQPLVAVYDGKAEVQLGDRPIQVGKGKELPLVETAEVKPQKFDRKAGGGLYNWSKVRSEYMAEANQAAAQTIIVNNAGWYGTGWYWNPWYSTWAFVPADGFLYSPFGFGWGFYSPAYFYYNAPLYYHYRPGMVVRGRPGFVGRPGFGGSPGFRGASGFHGFAGGPRAGGARFGGGMHR